MLLEGNMRDLRRLVLELNGYAYNVTQHFVKRTSVAACSCTNQTAALQRVCSVL